MPGAARRTARERAAAERYPIRFDEGDAEALPYADAGFDAVTSTLGVMFTADHQRAADELLRVCRPGGVIAMANWTPGRLHRPGVQDDRRPRPAAAGRDVAGDVGHRDLPPDALRRRASRRCAAGPATFTFRYRSPQHFLEFLRTNYGPMLKAFEILDDAGREALAGDLQALMTEANTATGTLAIPSEYLEVVATRSA